MHSDKIKLRRFALQLYFSGDVTRYNTRDEYEETTSHCHTHQYPTFIIGK